MATRAQLLDAAEQVFLTQGVAKTTLQQVAAAAGLTRGAIYWHFQDKADLFLAMMDRVTLPCENAYEAVEPLIERQPREAVLQMALAPLQSLAQSDQVTRVFAIAMHCTEYVGEMAPVRARYQQAVADYVSSMQAALNGFLPAAQAAPAAIGLFCLIDGLMGQWTLAPGSFDLLATGEHCVQIGRAHV